MTEETLVRGTLPIDRARASTELAERHLEPSYRLAALILGDVGEAEDATHDALVRAWRAWATLRDPARFEGWFQRILVNACRDRLRRRRHSSREIAVADVHAVDEGETTAERDALLEALRALSPQHRAVVVLRYYEDLTVDEIADRVGAGTGTVKSRLHYALRALRASYDAAERSSQGIPK